MKRGDNVERFLAVSKEKVDTVWEADLAQGYDTSKLLYLLRMTFR